MFLLFTLFMAFVMPFVTDPAHPEQLIPVMANVAFRFLFIVFIWTVFSLGTEPVFGFFFLSL